MMIIGCDLHTRYQQIAMLDTDTGELVERRLEHESGEVGGPHNAVFVVWESMLRAPRQRKTPKSSGRLRCV
jgi:hypothetical protein